MKKISLSKKVLITGIEGFTGYHLEKFFSDKGLEVYGTTLEAFPQKNYFQCDIRNYSEMESVILRVKPDYIIHLAAISFTAEEDRSLIYDTNVIGAENLLLSLVKNNLSPEKIIMVSSASVYGNQNESILDEALVPEPVNHYGISKLAMEKVVKTYYDKFSILIVRPFNYTGPKQGNHFLIPKIISHYKNKSESIELGNIHVAREFNDIRYVVDVYYQLLFSSALSDIVNLCTGKAWKISEIITLLNEMTGHNVRVEVNPEFCRENEIAVLKGSAVKLHSIIERTKDYTLKETLAYMLEIK